MNRLARFAVAVTVTSLIGMQIPVRNGVAMAQNGNCGGSNNNGGKILGVKSSTFVTIALGTLIVLSQTVGTEKAPATVSAMTDSSSNAPVSGVSASNGASASLLEVSSGTARELIDKCPTLSQQLANEGPFTVFLPSDEALSSVKLDGAKLETFLKRHIVLGRYSFSDLSNLSDGATLPTLAETELSVTHGEGGSVLVGGVEVSNDGHEGANGFSFTIKSDLQ